MHLVKAIRKNRNKLMAIFVVVIMGAFILGDMTCRQLAAISRSSVAAYYGENTQILNGAPGLFRKIGTGMGVRPPYVLREDARVELEVLRGSFAQQFLASQQDVNLLLLGQVLFFEPGMGEQVARSISSGFASMDIPASRTVVDDFFRQVKSENDQADLWILLNAEADKAGITSSTTEAAAILQKVIPAVTRGMPVSEFMARKMASGTPEESILAAYSKLIKVFRYAQLSTTAELLTTNQLRTTVANRLQTVDPNVVRIDATYFVDPNSVVPAADLTKQFEAYKAVTAGDYTDENPYGFGYMLPSRVQLEYLAVKLDDVRKSVAKPTIQEAQAYYQQNTSKYQYEAADANAPGGKVVKTKDYSEVADKIIGDLYTERVQSKANSILDDARKLVDSKLEGEFVENISDARYKDLVGSYEDAAKAVTAKDGIKVYAGRTGMLSAADFNFGRRGYTGALYIEGRTGSSTSLRKIAFAAARLDGAELGPFDMATPRMFETFGPLTDSVTDQLKALVRVVDAAPSQAPASLDVTYSIAGVRLDEPVSKSDVYNLRDEVARDVRLLGGMEKAGKMAEELKALTTFSDWKPVLQTWNARVGRKGIAEVFTIEPFGNIRRATQSELWAEKQRAKGQPEAGAMVSLKLKQAKLAEKFFALTTPGETSVKGLPAVVKFEPGATYYVIKTMSVKTIATTKDFEDTKAMLAYYTDMMQSQWMSLVFYNPRNIKQRMSYRQWDDRDLAAAVSKVMSEGSGQTAAGGEFVDPIGKRFSVAVSKDFVQQPDPQKTYVVPSTTEDGKPIPAAGQTLAQSVIGFNSSKGNGLVVIKAQVRQSFWDDFDHDFETIKKSYDLSSGKVDVALSKMDGTRAGRIAEVSGGKVTMSFFFKKDGMDHLITVSCPAELFAANADAIAQFVNSYHSLAAKN
jgi:hypothetical protein